MLKAPLVIALPTDYRSRARDLAPDLWHVRATSVELESGRFPAPPSPDARRSAASGRDDFGARAASSVDAEAARAIPEDVLRSLSTWKHLFRHASPVQVDPWIGIETVDLLRQHGFPERAREVATQVVDIARVQARSDDPVVPHERRRVLSAALDRLGDVSQELGRLEAAAGACEESLALRRQLRTALGDTPQVLSDLAISLNNVARIREDQGQVDVAIELWQEARRLLQRLAVVMDESPRFRADLRQTDERLAEREARRASGAT